jgi:hypothetical protein
MMEEPARTTERERRVGRGAQRSKRVAAAPIDQQQQIVVGNSAT